MEYLIFGDEGLSTGTLVVRGIVLILVIIVEIVVERPLLLLGFPKILQDLETSRVTSTVIYEK